ncbi:MAG: sugar transferase [Actinobacteria bacterium]|nr:sugar transferase [Actinomycetota bacterium]
MTRRQAFAKRSFDLVLAAVGLAATLPLILLAVAAATVDTRRFGLFVQQRVGRRGRTFPLLKVRTMRPHATVTTSVTTADDPRVTRLGALLRRFRIDELPQLANVLAGHMSFVGPRPDVPGFADRLEGADRIVLEVRPGITGPATLKYHDEAGILAAVDDPEAYNRDVIFPDKVAINRAYVEEWSFRGDLGYLAQTLRSVMGREET